MFFLSSKHQNKEKKFLVKKNSFLSTWHDSLSHPSHPFPTRPPRVVISPRKLNENSQRVKMWWNFFIKGRKVHRSSEFFLCMWRRVEARSEKLKIFIRSKFSSNFVIIKPKFGLKIAPKCASSDASQNYRKQKFKTHFESAKKCERKFYQRESFKGKIFFSIFVRVEGEKRKKKVEKNLRQKKSKIQMKNRNKNGIANEQCGVVRDIVVVSMWTELKIVQKFS